MIIADENIDYRIIESLRENGIEVFSVFEELRGIKDAEIIEMCQRTGFVILTEDKDFGEWVFAHKKVNISVILLRYQFTETAEITKALINVINGKSYTIQGRFTTLTKSKIRQREI